MGDRCDECGFDYEALAVADAVDELRRLGRRYRAPLTRFLADEDGDALVRAHPLPGTWSALEYACHVRRSPRRRRWGCSRGDPLQLRSPAPPLTMHPRLRRR